MWQCPKCNRSFKRQDQQHFCGDKPKTIEEYIHGFDREIQKQLLIVRECLKEALPDALEKISWSMPTYWKERNIIHFAGHKKHIGLYPGKKAVVQFSEELDKLGYKYSKGSIQIPYNEHMPSELIKEIANWCYSRNAL